MKSAMFILEPEVRRIPRGGFLATTRAWTRIRIGVVGATEAEARMLFADSLAKWKELSESEDAITTYA